MKILLSFILSSIVMSESALAQWTPVTTNPTSETTLKVGCEYRFKIGNRSSPSTPVYYYTSRLDLNGAPSGPGVLRTTVNGLDLTNLPEAYRVESNGTRISSSVFVASTLKFNYESIELQFSSSKYKSIFGLSVYYTTSTGKWEAKYFVFQGGSFALEQHCAATPSPSPSA